MHQHQHFAERPQLTPDNKDSVNMALEGISLALGKEVLKPTSGVLDALLAPKIRKIKLWAEERDLKARVSGEALEEAFSVYLRQLLRKVSVVKTLVFPEKSFPLEDIYEPLMLENCTGKKAYRFGNSQSEVRKKSERISELSMTRAGRRVFIIDDAGMGKSTFARYLVLDEIANRDRVPIFLELRRLGAGASLVEMLAAELDQISKKFDRESFRVLLERGRFLAILDGLDEVSPELRSEVCAQIEDFSTRAERCAIILTARPEVALPRISDASTYSFLPLTSDQAASLMKRYDAVADIDVGARLIARIDSLPQHFLEKPILVSLLYRSYGYNGEVSPNVASFYDELYSALYKGHDLTKGGFARPKLCFLEFDGFRRLVRGFAFLLIAQPPDGVMVESLALEYVGKAIELSGVIPSSPTNFLNDLLLAVPLLIRDGSEIRFAHKTIGEYFAAEFISAHPQGAKFTEALRDAGDAERFFEVMRFLKNINPALFNRVIAKPMMEKFLELASLYEDEQMRTLMLVAGESCLVVLKNKAPIRGYRSNGHIIRTEFSGHIMEFQLNSAYPFCSVVIDEVADRVEVALGPIVFKKLFVGKIGELISFSDERLHSGDAAEQFKMISADMITLTIRELGREPRTPIIRTDRVQAFLAKINAEDSATRNIFNILKP